MKYIYPGKIKGTVRAPHSKSVFQRSVAAACLANGTSELSVGPLLCADDQAALNLARNLGGQVEVSPGLIRIKGPICPGSTRISCGESGLSLRVFCALSSLFPVEITLEAQGSLSRRPIGMVVEPLEKLGASCYSLDGFPPVVIKGPIQGGKLQIDGSTTSQFLTGLLIALPCCPRDSRIKVNNLKSKPYVELTLELLERFGVKIKAEPSLKEFYIPGRQNYQAGRIKVEGDWSGASFLLVAGALAGQVEVSGLNLDSPQADRRILEALESAGVLIRAEGDTVKVESGALNPFDFDATDCPDLFPPLAVLALGCPGTTRIRGVSRLKHKESDRAGALLGELGRLGGQLELNGDMMLLSGGGLVGGRADSRGDHRIAMAAAVAALNSESPVQIEGENSINKSYPGFFDDLKKLGARLK